MIDLFQIMFSLMPFPVGRDYKKTLLQFISKCYFQRQITEFHLFYQTCLACLEYLIFFLLLKISKTSNNTKDGSKSTFFCAKKAHTQFNDLWYRFLIIIFSLHFFHFFPE
jgi:hypothetical protein